MSVYAHVQDLVTSSPGDQLVRTSRPGQLELHVLTWSRALPVVQLARTPGTWQPGRDLVELEIMEARDLAIIHTRTASLSQTSSLRLGTWRIYQVLNASGSQRAYTLDTRVFRS